MANSQLVAQYVDHMGTDLSVVNAAKVSFSKASTTLGDPEKSLIKFLASGLKTEDRVAQAVALANMLNVQDVEQFIEHIKMQATHWTPFTHTAISLRCSAPVPIRTQCFKHKIGFTENEESRRYIKSTPEIFVPEYFRAAAVDVKQGSGEQHEHSAHWLHIYEKTCRVAVETYLMMINDGVCPEQARFILPQGTIVNWIWTGNLASYARFFNQRTDSHAQKESQYLAKEIGKIIQPLFPASWTALTRKV